MMSRPTPAPAAPIARLAMTLPDDQHFGGLDDTPLLAVSPRGRCVAYVAVASGREQLHVRAIDSVESKALPGTEQATTLSSLQMGSGSASSRRES